MDKKLIIEYSRSLEGKIRDRLMAKGMSFIGFMGIIFVTFKEFSYFGLIFSGLITILGFMNWITLNKEIKQIDAILGESEQ